MNQQCKVCGEPAAGFHFGAFTCEGCKSFFGRTYNNLGSITECKNNGECVINKKNRTACKACRLRKCLLVGMSKSGSRYGRRSNWFKIHCLLQEQSQNGTGNMFAAPPGFFPGSFPLLSPDRYLPQLPRKAEHSESGESDEETRSTGGLSFLHKTPSPLSLPCLPSPAGSGAFFPPPIYPISAWPPPSDLLLCSPALAGVAVEQDRPIDLSIKTSAISYHAPPTPLSQRSRSNSPHSDTDSDDLSIDVELCKDSLSIKNNPLDLTAKRVQVPQSG